MRKCKERVKEEGSLTIGAPRGLHLEGNVTALAKVTQEPHTHTHYQKYLRARKKKKKKKRKGAGELEEVS